MREPIAVALLLSFGTAQAASAEHLVPAADAQQRLVEATCGRAQRIVVVQSLLDTPEATQASAKLGVDLDRVKSQVALLSDDDLRDLALRAEAMRSDPVAGSSAAAWAPGIVVATVVVVALLGFLAYANRD